MKYLVILLLFYLINIVSGQQKPQQPIANVSQLIEAQGYPVQNYYAHTSDGFYLSVVRIPYGRESSNSTNRPVAFLQHGLLDTSATWVLNDPSESLGFILADAGFDVFLGNVRGNTYSLQNSLYNPDSQEFWDLIDFDNMIALDLPTMIDKALEISGKSSLIYIGHSQGTLMGFGAFPEQLDLAKKVDLFIALAPACWVKHQQSELLTILADLDLADILYYFGEKSFLPSDWALQFLAGTLCEEDPIACEDVIFMLCGTDRPDLNSTRVPLYMQHTPGGTSVRNMLHWSQEVTEGNFQMFDYGLTGNLQHYGQAIPPQYFPQNLTFPPIAMFTGSIDKLADPQDVQILIDALPQDNKPIYIHNEPNYEHLDFVWGIDAHVKIYPQVVQLSLKYSK